MVEYIALMIFLLPLMLYTFTSQKKLTIYILLVGGVPLTTFMPSLSLLGFMGGLAPQAAFLFFVVFSLFISLLMSADRVAKELFRFSVVIFFFAYATASLVWCENMMYGIRLLIKLFAPLMMALLIVSVVNNKKDIGDIFKATLICSIIVISLALLNYVTGGAIGGDKVKEKWMGLNVLTAPHMSPANFSFFIFCVATMCLVNFMYHRKYIYFFGYLIMLAVIMAAFTRISMASLVVATGITIFFLSRNNIIRFGFPIFVIVGFVVALFTVDSLKERMFYQSDNIEISEALSDFNSLEKNLNTSGRLALWKSVISDFDDSSALFGAGIGSVDNLLAVKYDSLRLHSEFLRIYLDLGLIGLILFVVAFIQIIMILLRLMKFPPSRAYSVLALAGLSGYIITLFTDNTLNYVTEFGIYVYTFIGLAIVATRLIGNDQIKSNKDTEKVFSAYKGSFESVVLR